MLSITYIDVWLSKSMQGSKLNFPENHLLGTYNCKMVAIKQILKKTHRRKVLLEATLAFFKTDPLSIILFS